MLQRFSPFLSLFILISLTVGAKITLPSEKTFPHLNKIYHKGWIDLNKNNRKDIYEDPSQPIKQRIDDLLGQMNIEEKAGQLVTYYGYKKVLTDTIPTQKWLNTVLKHGVANIDEHLNGEIYDLDRLTACINETQRFFIEYTRLGIPVDFSNEGIRGLTAPKATSFPSMNGLGCTWNRSIAYTMGKIEGSEARAMGYTNVYAPILDVARDQRWGRWEGSISEDPFLVAELGVAMARGIQDQKVVSSPKHYVGYGDCKAARQWDARTDPHITPSEMYYIHEYPFRRVFQEAGSLGVMCAYNDYNGVPIAGNYHYLTEVLREEMGFKGYVVSDSYAIGRMDGIHKTTYNGKESCLMALLAGLNVRTEFNTPDQYAQWICELVAEGKLPEKRVDELVSHVLYVKFWLGLFDNPYPANPQTVRDNVATPQNLQCALEASRQCLVLLKNQDATLPLGTKYKKIAVVGPNAKSHAYIPTHYGPREYGNYVSVYEGIKNIYKDTDVSVDYAKGIDLVNKGWPENELIDDTLTSAEQNDIAQAINLAQNSDIVIAVMGDGTSTSGESRTRSSLDLPGHQEDLIKALVATGKPVVMVLIWGRPASINFANKYCPAILAAGYPGAQGGQAIAEALKGDFNPGGKLTGTWPKTVGQLPMNIPTKPNANMEEMKYHTVANKGLLYCFGHGLSYTTFAYSNLSIDSINSLTGNVNVSLTVENTGSMEGDEVVQLYINDVVSSTTTYEKSLRGFERVHLQPGEKKTISFRLRPDDLIMINTEGQRVVEPGEFRVMIGASYEDIRLSGSFYVGSTSEDNKSLRNATPQKIMHDTDR